MFLDIYGHCLYMIRNIEGHMQSIYDVNIEKLDHNRFKYNMFYQHIISLLLSMKSYSVTYIVLILKFQNFWYQFKYVWVN